MEEKIPYGDEGNFITIRKSPEVGYPYPWMFSVTVYGRTLHYAGMPNQCATRHQAICRAKSRLRRQERSLS